MSGPPGSFVAVSGRPFAPIPTFPIRKGEGTRPEPRYISLPPIINVPAVNFAFYSYWSKFSASAPEGAPKFYSLFGTAEDVP